MTVTEFDLYIDVPASLAKRKRPRMTGVRKKSTGTEDTVRQVLAGEAFKRATYPELRARIVRGTAGAVVFTVPSAAWVTEISHVLDDLNEDICTVLKLDGKKQDDSTVTVSRALAEGRTVVAVTPSAQYLPAIFRTVTDETVAVDPPVVELVATVIRKVSKTGRIPRSFGDTNTQVLDFDELAGMIVMEGDALVAANRVMRAVESKTRMSTPGETLPDIETATEFGAARLWAMDLKEDLEDIRAKKISASQADRGAVIYGPPGTGKTLLARSLGQFLGVPVIVESMGNFFSGGSGYLDSVIKQQRAAFEKAKAVAPSILFLDEIDALPDLDKISNRGRDWWAPVVLDFLTLLDGAASDRSGVIVIGATNRINMVAKAVLRPGRLERSIYLGPPDAAGVVRVLRHHLEGDLASENLDRLGELCASHEMTPAVLMEAVRAARRAARRAQRPFLVTDLDERLMPKSTMSRNDRRRVAVHEAGHAVMGQLLYPGSVASVSMYAMGGGNGGLTTFAPPEDLIETPETFEKRLSITLAGRAAEIVMLGSASTGAGGPDDSDLAQATALLASASLSLGLGSVPRWRCTPENAVSILNIDREIRAEVEAEMTRIADAAVSTLAEHCRALDAVAIALEENRGLNGDEVAKIIDANPAENSAGHTRPEGNRTLGTVTSA